MSVSFALWSYRFFVGRARRARQIRSPIGRIRPRRDRDGWS